MEKQTLLGECSVEELKAELNKRQGDKKMYPAKCSLCGDACEVPFEPRDGWAIKCKPCYFKEKDKV